MPDAEVVATNADDGSGRVHRLVVAPPHLRCKFVRTLVGGGRMQCTRFRIRLPGNRRDDGCISHSTSKHARQSRAKGRATRIEARKSNVERRRQHWLDVLAVLGDHLPNSADDFGWLRWNLSFVLVRNEFTLEEFRELRLLLTDWERSTIAWRNSEKA